jgi:stage V sporulation protein K
VNSFREHRNHGEAWALTTPCVSIARLKRYDEASGTTYANEFVDYGKTFARLFAGTTVHGMENKADSLNAIAVWLERTYQDSPTDPTAVGQNVTSRSSDSAEQKPRVRRSRPKGESRLETLLADLHALTGLATVKNEVDDLVAFLKVQGIRKDRGMAPASISRHLVFYGNPGTGKTTVARLLSSIYASLGFLSKGHLVETDRSGMVAGFVGQTAIKTREVCEKALGGVLFIDEAYALAVKDNDYGQEAIDTLLKFMEDNRDNLVVVVAGYPDKMAGFLDSNPGIRSRFTRFMNFQDYSPEELSNIFAGFCKEGGFSLSDGASAKARGIFEEQFIQRDATFGNARFARNLFEQCLVRHARRITKADHITDGMLTMLEEEDVEWVG